MTPQGGEPPHERDASHYDRASALRRRRRGRLLSAAVIGVAAATLIVVPALMGGDDKSPAKSERAKPTAACESNAPQPADPRSYARPEQVLEPDVDYGAVLRTSCGDITLDLLESSPVAVNNFIFLAREGFYDGLIFHRVVEQFIIETGDPDGALDHPPDGPGYTIQDSSEFPSGGRKYVFGVVAMANTGQLNTAGSRFFIVVHEDEPAGLDPLYSILGRVDESSEESLATIGKIAAKPTRGGDDPARMDEPLIPVFMESVEITES